MKGEEIINAMDLPPDALVHQHVPKSSCLKTALQLPRISGASTKASRNCAGSPP